MSVLFMNGSMKTWLTNSEFLLHWKKGKGGNAAEQPAMNMFV